MSVVVIPQSEATEAEWALLAQVAEVASSLASVTLGEGSLDTQLIQLKANAFCLVVIRKDFALSQATLCDLSADLNLRDVSQYETLVSRYEAALWREVASRL